MPAVEVERHAPRVFSEAHEGCILQGRSLCVSCIGAQDQQLARLADAIAQRVGPQRFHVWFDNSTRLDLRQDGLEIAVPNDFISEWIGKNFTRPIQEAAHEVLGGPLPVRFSVVPKLFETDGASTAPSSKPAKNGHAVLEGATVRPLVVASRETHVSRAVTIMPPARPKPDSRADSQIGARAETSSAF